MANEVSARRKWHLWLAIIAVVLVGGAIAWASLAWLLSYSVESEADAAGIAATYRRAALMGALGLLVGLISLSLRARRLPSSSPKRTS